MQKNSKEEFKLYFTPKQTLALESLENPNTREMLYGGAKGGGKSVFMVEYAYLRAQQLINDLGIPKDPTFIMPVGYLGRKRGVDFTKTTLETWKKIIPSHLYRIKPLDKEIIIDDRVKLFYGGMDDESNINKMNSAEFAFIGIDQAEEISRDDLGLLKGTLRLRYKGRVPDYKVLLTANPAPCFLKSDYIDNPPADKSKVFIQALPTDNPFLDQAYIKNLNDAFRHRPELIRAYVHGSWDDLEGLGILIKHPWIRNCVNNTPREGGNRRVTSADVARYGADETVIYNMVDNKIVSQDISGMNSVDENAAKILQMASKNSSDVICIDGDGFGGGVVDRVRTILHGIEDPKVGRYVLEINSGKKAINSDKYANTKTEFFFYAAALLAETAVGIPDDNILMGDLGSIKYEEVPGGRWKIEPKSAVRRRISRSPDRADAAVYGWWATQFIEKKKNDYDRKDPLQHSQSMIKRGGYGWDTLNNPSIGGYAWR